MQYVPIFIAIVVAGVPVVGWFFRLEAVAKRNREEVDRLDQADKTQLAVVNEIKDTLGELNSNVALVRQSIEHSEATSSTIAQDFRDHSQRASRSFERMFERLESVEVKLAAHDVQLQQGHGGR